MNKEEWKQFMEKHYDMLDLEKEPLIKGLLQKQTSDIFDNVIMLVKLHVGEDHRLIEQLRDIKKKWERQYESNKRKSI